MHFRPFPFASNVELLFGRIVTEDSVVKGAQKAETRVRDRVSPCVGVVLLGNAPLCDHVTDLLIQSMLVHAALCRQFQARSVLFLGASTAITAGVEEHHVHQCHVRPHGRITKWKAQHVNKDPRGQHLYYVKWTESFG